MTMGRIGDGDVHAAYVEFRAKESDKVPNMLPVASPLHIALHKNVFFQSCNHHQRQRRPPERVRT